MIIRPIKLATAALTAAVGLGLLAPAVAKGEDAGQGTANTERFALVIGNNGTLDKSQSPLRFADDDAARMTELLRGIGAQVELLTTFDQDSQAVFQDLVSGAKRPTRKNVLAAHARLVTAMESAKDAGGRAELLIYYSGHGDVGPDGQGFLTLDRGKLTRSDLFQTLLKRSPADHNHLLVDACRSEEFVLSRGKDWKPDRAAPEYSRSVETFLAENHLGAFPNTGVLLAHSADQQTHEWERYRGGIFTHQLLSGMRGGADLNGDGHTANWRPSWQRRTVASTTRAHGSRSWPARRGTTNAIRCSSTRTSRVAGSCSSAGPCPTAFRSRTVGAFASRTSTVRAPSPPTSGSRPGRCSCTERPSAVSLAARKPASKPTPPGRSRSIVWRSPRLAVRPAAP
ncbi:MAG: caspase family protein [Deltaproteobacteria bacterium]|nr:caspase family protein [Deltaproteobacteria bacterium]